MGVRADEQGVGAGRRDGREGAVIVTVPDLDDGQLDSKGEGGFLRLSHLKREGGIHRREQRDLRRSWDCFLEKLQLLARQPYRPARSRPR
jgi:hypothetical protein